MTDHTLFSGDAAFAAQRERTSYLASRGVRRPNRRRRNGARDDDVVPGTGAGSVLRRLSP